jgi:hypothetical protein
LIRLKPLSLFDEDKSDRKNKNTLISNAKISSSSTLKKGMEMKEKSV